VIAFAAKWKKIDIFICSGRSENIMMRSKDLNNEARSTARQYCADLYHWKKTLKSSGLSNHSVVYGEIGWRSAEGDGGSMESFEIFWKTLSSCSLQNNLDINVFNIIDEVSKAKVTALNKTRDKFGGYGIVQFLTETNNTGKALSRPQVISEVMLTSTPNYLESKQISTEKSVDQTSPKLASPDKPFQNSKDHNSPQESSNSIPIVLGTISFVVAIVVSIVAGTIYFFNRYIVGRMTKTTEQTYKAIWMRIRNFKRSM